MTNTDRDAWLERLEDERRSLVLPTFGIDLAWELGAAIRERAAVEKLPVAIEVALTGHRLFYAAMPGAMPDNAAWIHRKRNVVERFLESSLLMTLRCEAAGTTINGKYRLNDEDFVHSGGGVAIRVPALGVIGTVTVSGLSQYEDHALAAAALGPLKERLADR